MAFQQNGYVIVPGVTLTYDTWRQYALTHGINVDFSWGNQCWDVPALLWYQYGLYFKTGNGYAWGAWAYMRDANARGPFIKVERKVDIKRGDCVVFYSSGLNYAGHVAFADEDYNGTDTLKCLGQNQGQGISWGTPSNVKPLNLRTFMGAFRNTNWKSTPEPPTPEITSSEVVKRKFPWAIYDRKFRHRY